MGSHSSRGLILRAHLLEMIISVAAIGLGLFLWLSMSGSNSGINLLAGAALLVAGFIAFVFCNEIHSQVLATMIIGERLRLLREQKGLSQYHIEQRTGLLRCYISRVEHNHTTPSVETLEKMARGLG